MRSFVACSLALALAAVAVAGELKSGPQPDQAIGPFDVVKCGGGTDDDVSVGEQLCYRCRYGNRPMVMVFTRTVNDTVAALTSKLNEEVAEHKDAKLSAFVNLIGDDNREPLEAQAKDLAKKAKASGESDFPPAESDGMEENLIPLYETFMEEWARKWLDEKIPALDGQSPREAVKSPEGKEKVRELLKEFENQEERKKKDGEPYWDVQILRRKLNL